MAAENFQPKTGRIGSKPGAKSQRYVNRVIRNMRMATQRRHGSKKSSFTGSRIGRRYSQATALSLRSFQPGRRCVIVKARFTSFRRGGMAAARAHLCYIPREGDPHQFRIIVAPKDGAEFNELKPFIRDLMTQAESDLGTKLDWVAVDHFNTGHPHTHIIIRGRDDKGGDLIIARDYISQGLRERARNLATLELGPESEDGLQQKMAREIRAEGLPGLTVQS